MLRPLFALLIAIAVVGCDKASQSKEKDGKASLDAPTAPIWSASDLNPGSNAKDLTAEEARNEILGYDDLYNKTPDEDNAFNTCTKPLADDIAFAGSSDDSVYAGVIDVSKCVDKLEGLPTASGSFVVRNYAKIKCADVDFSSIDGKRTGDFDDDGDPVTELCADADWREAVSTSSALADIKAEVETEEGTQSYHLVYETRSATFSANMQPCRQTLTDGNWANEECLIVNRNITKTATLDDKELEDHGTEIYVKIDFADVVAPRDHNAKWNKSGVAKIRINNWEGTVTYTGEDEAPDFELSDGTDTITGKVDDPIE